MHTYYMNTYIHEFMYAHAYEQEAKTHKDAADAAQEKLLDEEAQNAELRQQVCVYVCVYMCMYIYYMSV